MISINLGLCIFNLIPIPPLDGSKILYAFLPNRILFKIFPYERYFQLALLILLWMNILSVPMSKFVGFFYQLFINFAQGVLL
jgi:Zn-dependent protease